MVEKICVICGKEFTTNRSRKLTCSKECSRKLNSQQTVKRYALQRNALFKSRKKSEDKKLIANIVKLKKAVTEAAHRRRLQRQREASALGLSYAQYIAQKGIREI